jgi:hypothetical protein
MLIYREAEHRKQVFKQASVDQVPHYLSGVSEMAFLALFFKKICA